MAFGEKLKRLRQDRGWSQAVLARRLKLHQKQISGYERGLHMPSAEVLVRIAKLLSASLDYLVLDDENGKRQSQIADLELLHKLEEIDKLSPRDKELVKGLLDTFIIKSRFQRLAREQEAMLG